MNKNVGKNKILVILGPTAAGKSDLAVVLAKKFNGEIISADSRQVYRGLNIGTGKVPLLYTRKKRVSTKASTPPISRMGGIPKYKNIPHHLIDFVNPKKQFSVAEYRKLGQKALRKIWRKNKLPIICGGTGLYIDALVNDTPLPDVPPDPKLRVKLEKLSVAELFAKLQKLDPVRAQNIDPKNPRRLVRALEIVLKTGHPVPNIYSHILQNMRIDVLKIGIRVKPKKLRERIHARLIKRMKRGMVAEARRLHQKGLSWKRMEELGLEYRYLSRYLRGMITKIELEQKIELENWRYAKRQMTWWKRDKNITWIKTEKQAADLLKQFLS